MCEMTPHVVFTLQCGSKWERWASTNVRRALLGRPGDRNTGRRPPSSSTPSTPIRFRRTGPTSCGWRSYHVGRAGPGRLRTRLWDRPAPSATNRGRPPDWFAPPYVPKMLRQPIREAAVHRLGAGEQVELHRIGELVQRNADGEQDRTALTQSGRAALGGSDPPARAPEEPHPTGSTARDGQDRGAGSTLRADGRRSDAGQQIGSWRKCQCNNRPNSALSCRALWRCADSTSGDGNIGASAGSTRPETAASSIRCSRSGSRRSLRWCA